MWRVSPRCETVASAERLFRGVACACRTSFYDCFPVLLPMLTLMRFMLMHVGSRSFPKARFILRRCTHTYMSQFYSEMRM